MGTVHILKMNKMLRKKIKKNKRGFLLVVGLSGEPPPLSSLSCKSFRGKPRDGGQEPQRRGARLAGPPRPRALPRRLWEWRVSSLCTAPLAGRGGRPRSPTPRRIRGMLQLQPSQTRVLGAKAAPPQVGNLGPVSYLKGVLAIQSRLRESSGPVRVAGHRGSRGPRQLSPG